MATVYDPKTDYSVLIAQEAAKGVGADKTALASLEAARNAKIKGEGISNYNTTSLYTPGITSTPTATSQQGYLESIYAAKNASDTAALESAYNQKVLALDERAGKVPLAYYNAKNTTAADAELVRKNMNEQAAASGIGSGAGTQIALAMNTAAQGNLSALDAAQAQALAAIEAERSQVKVSYQDAIAQAIKTNNYQLANELYNEAVRVDSSYTSAAQKDYAYGLGQTADVAKKKIIDEVSDELHDDGPDKIINDVPDVEPTYRGSGSLKRVYVPEYGDLAVDDVERLASAGYLKIMFNSDGTIKQISPTTKQRTSQISTTR